MRACMACCDVSYTLDLFYWSRVYFQGGLLFRSAGSDLFASRYRRKATVAKRAATDKLFRQELRNFRRILPHTHVISLLAADVPRRTLILERAVGSLVDALIACDLSLEYHVFVMDALVDGVLHIHSHGLAHMDLKPDNALLFPDGRLAWCDFGLMVNAHECVLSGTRGYCAPEVCARKLRDGRKADVWSLGVTLFASFHGYMPFEQASPDDWRFRVASASLGSSMCELVRGWYHRPPATSDSIEHALDGMLRICPSQRAIAWSLSSTIDERKEGVRAAVESWLFCAPTAEDGCGWTPLSCTRVGDPLSQ